MRLAPSFPCFSRPARRLIVLCALLASPALAAPPWSVNLSLDKISSVVDGDFVYAPMAAESNHENEYGRLALDIFLTNLEAFPVEVVSATLNFDDPDSSTLLQGGLRMRCGEILMRQEVGEELMMPPGAPCRVGLMPDPQLLLPAPGRLAVNINLAVNNQPIILPESLSERDLRPYANDTASGAYPFPIKAEDLPPGTFISSRSPTPNSSHRFGGDTTEIYGYDIRVIRYDDDTDDWTGYFALSEGETLVDNENQDHLIWQVPVYAVADGVVANCGRTNPDNASTNAPNWFNIYHGEELLRYSHLKQYSPPIELCEEGALIKKGDQLGVVGNSGMSSGPHLHFEARRDGEPVPLLIEDAFMVERELNFPDPPHGNAPWFRMAGHAFNFEATAMWPSGLRRRGDLGDVEITATSLVSPSATRTVAASRTAAGNLRVSLFATGSDGQPDLLASENGSGVAKMSLTQPYATSDAALAMITSGGALKIAGYDVTSTGLTRTVEHTSSTATDVVAAQGNFPDGIVTAVRTQFGNLKVIAWEVDPAGTPSIVRRGEDVGGSIEEIAIVRTQTFPGVVTALRLPGGRLKLVSWRVSNSGNTVAREDEIEDALVQQVSIVRLGTFGYADRLVTAVRTLAGDLELVSWSVDSSGNITRLADHQAGEITEVSAARADARHVLTALGNDDGDFKLIAWDVDPGDGTFTRRAEVVGGQATSIRQDGAKGSVPMAVTALADGAGDLKLIQFEVLLTEN